MLLLTKVPSLPSTPLAIVGISSSVRWPVTYLGTLWQYARLDAIWSIAGPISAVRSADNQ